MGSTLATGWMVMILAKALLQGTGYGKNCVKGMNCLILGLFYLRLIAAGRERFVYLVTMRIPAAVPSLVL